MYQNILVPTDGLVEDTVEDATERGIVSTTSVLRGVPHEVILEYADQQEIGLIVMGKRGATGIWAPHMGSVTDRVLREAAVPIVRV